MSRFLLAILAACLLGCPMALAKEPPKGGTTAEPPKGYETFFTEINKVMQSYPDAAKRFSIIDKKTVKSEFHHCPKGYIWACIEVCADFPHCTGCALYGCTEILK